MPGPLLILGASARASAFSAVRAGFSPSCVDLFADLDLTSACSVRRVSGREYPEGLVRAALEAPPGPWIYTGAIENHPDLIDRIAADRPLWGNNGEVVRQVRDPIALAETLRFSGLPAIDVRLDPSGLPRDGSWLSKPLRSAAGLGIRPLAGQGGPLEGPGRYYQRRIEGPSGSAVFLADRGKARLVGVTRQWVGRPGVPFGYVGNIGPIRVSAGLRRMLDSIGRTMVEAFGLRGLFGVDFVQAEGVVWTTEVNPRYSASVEVLEWASGRAMLREHAAVFDPGIDAPGYADCIAERGRVVGKVVVYAPASGTIPEGHRWPRPTPGAMPKLADLPRPGSAFRAGQPVLTLLDQETTAEACRRFLESRLAAWRSRLRSWARSDPEGEAD